MWAPARSLAADWLAPPPVMKPWNRPARTLARPVAVSSRSGWGERRDGHGPLDLADDVHAAAGQVAQGDHDDAGHDHQQGRNLPDDDGQPQAEHEPGLHRRGDEARHEPHSQRAQGHQDEADQDGQGGRQLAEAGRVAHGHGRDQRRRDGRRGRGGADTSCREPPNRA
jgi:hypothetical protein